jgi:RecA-family ATPase
MMDVLEPDRDMIETFVDAVFRRASAQGFVAIRSFYEDEDRPFTLTAIAFNGDRRFQFLTDTIETYARTAAQAVKPVCFCPPLAIFADRDKAREVDVLEGVVLSVECDQYPQQARQTLEQLLGPATVVVRSGGIWVNGGTVPEDKLHLHWRLATPAGTKDMLVKLKKARTLATKLVGGDASNVPPCHPIRWPGSWHRKAEPRLCAIDTIYADNEINLDSALARLVAAMPAEADPEDHDDDGTGDVEWDHVVGDIISGKAYHRPLVALAARCIGAGMVDGQTVKLLRSIMLATTAPHDARWQSRFDGIPRIVRSAREKFAAKAAAPVMLAFADMTLWDSTPIPDRQWAVLDRIPLRQPTLFSGEGATGKSIITLQLVVAHVLGKDWLRSLPEKGPAIYFGAEDELDELRRRLAAIASFYGFTFADLIKGGLHLLSFAGLDPLLATANREGKITPTPLFDRLIEAARDIKPKCIAIDTSADVFGGNEIDRTQVRGFINLLRKLAITADGSVVLLAHPSLTGINSGSGISGSTAWHNSVRARLFLKTPKAKDDDGNGAGNGDHNDLRELSFLKNNYGRCAETLTLRYRDGLFLPEAGTSSLEKAALEQRIDNTFVTVLGKLIDQKRPVSPSVRAATYAPTVIAGHPDGKVYSRAEYRDAMERLINANKIHIVEIGPPSRTYRYLALGPVSETPANG